MSTASDPVFVTGNKNKVLEVTQILGRQIESVELDIDEVQSLDIRYIARRKAESAYMQLHRPVIVDDAGLYIDAWGGFPGPLVAHIAKSGGCELLLRMMRGEDKRAVHFLGTATYYDGKILKTCVGEMRGSIAMEIVPGGWGFEPIFIAEGYTAPLSTISPSVKNAISHRAKAFQELRKFLK